MSTTPLESPTPFSLLVAYDDSPCSEAAIGTLGSAGLPRTGRAAVVSVAETALLAGEAVGSGYTLAASMRSLAERAVEAAEAGAAKLREVLPGWDVEAKAFEGSAYFSLVEEAEQRSADLVCLGTHGRGAAVRMILGSTSQFVLSHAKCSVRVARAVHRTPDRRPPRLLVAVDGSGDSAAALAEIRRRTWPAGTEAKLLVVVEAGDDVTVRSRARPQPWAAVPPEQVLEAAARSLESCGLDLGGELVEGDPKEVIVDRASRYGSDCIFLGAQGRGRIQRLVMGSVSAAVAIRAPCSVEVARVRVPTPLSDSDAAPREAHAGLAGQGSSPVATAHRGFVGDDPDNLA